MLTEAQHGGTHPAGNRPSTENDVAADPVDPRPTQANITVRIAKNYHQEPVISHLISKYGLTVNITAALLGENTQEDGWFNLELQGTDRQIHDALSYLNELDLEVWNKNSADEQEGW